jgi:cytochrome c-type biogenesis protein CcmH
VNTSSSSPNPSPRRYPSAGVLALGAAAILAVASVGVAVSRSASDDDAPAAPHGTQKPDEPVGSVEEQIAKLEARLRQDPDNAADWRMLGWSLFETGDLMRAAEAYRRAAQVEPNNAENWSSLGEALQTASRDVSPEAAEAFKRAVSIDPRDPRARYFLGVQADLAGNHAQAIDGWIALLKDTPPGAVWENDLRRTILQVAEREKISITGRIPAASPAAAGSVATAAIPGPTPEQLAAASSIPPGQQDEMVQGMVGRLAARLETNPKDADGWIRLMRSYKVLNEGTKAQDALRKGTAAFNGDAATQARIRKAADELGI